MIALKNIIFKSFTNYFQTLVLILTANTHWIKGNVSETKMNLEMRSAACQTKQNCDCILLSSQIYIFEKFTDNSLIHVFILTALTHLIKGIIELEKNDLRNALSCFTEGIEVNCKGDRLNAMLYFVRSTIHGTLGKFTRHIRFPLWLS